MCMQAIEKDYAQSEIELVEAQQSKNGEEPAMKLGSRLPSLPTQMLCLATLYYDMHALLDIGLL